MALAFTEEVAAARLFVREVDAIYSRKITAAEFKAGRANLGPRRGAFYVLLVGYDDLGRPSVILGGYPAS